MNAKGEIKQLWLSVKEVALPLADVRDAFLKVQGGEPRFMQLDEAYDNLNAIEQALYEYLQIKSRWFSKKPDKEVLMLSVAALANARILMEVCRGELSMFYQVSS